MATGAKLPVTRQLGFVALIAADGSVDQAWTLGTQSVQALQDLLGAMPLVRDGNLRASLYPKVKPLLHGLPGVPGRAGEGEADSRAATCGSSCPARRTLTLAEVEVLSDGRNVARQGRATQKNTAHGGDAQKAIDGKTAGAYGAGSQTHTEENTAEPLVGSRPRLRGPDRVDRDLQPHRRHPRQAARRLHPQGPRRRPQRRLRAGEPEGPRPAGALPGHPRGGESGRPDPPRGDDRADVRPRPGNRDLPRAGAVRARQHRPPRGDPGDRSAFPRPTGRPKRPGRLLDSIIAYVRRLPTRSRTAPEAVDALQLADALAATLPLDQAKLVRKPSSASWACGSSAWAPWSIRCSSTRTAWSSRPAGRSRSSSRTPT